MGTFFDRVQTEEEARQQRVKQFGKNRRRVKQRRIRRTLYPPSTAGGAEGWGLTYDQFKAATAGDHFRRAAFFANPFSAPVREEALNSIGMLTKAQKEAVGKAGLFSKTMHKLIPIGAVAGLAMSAMDGDTAGYITDFAAPSVAAIGGWRAGKSVGYGIASMVSKRGGFKLGVGLVGGLTAGAAGGLVTYAVGNAIKSSVDSNNKIRQWEDDWIKSDFKHEVIRTQNTMTSRRRAAEGLSKSYLNNRGQVLGNEASIMRGLM